MEASYILLSDCSIPVLSGDLHVIIIPSFEISIACLSCLSNLILNGGLNIDP